MVVRNKKYKNTSVLKDKRFQYKLLYITKLISNKFILILNILLLYKHEFFRIDYANSFKKFNIAMTDKPNFSSLYPYVYKQLASLSSDELLKLVNDERIKNGDEPFVAFTIHEVQRKDLTLPDSFKESNRKILDQRTLNSWKL